MKPVVGTLLSIQLFFQRGDSSNLTCQQAKSSSTRKKCFSKFAYNKSLFFHHRNNTSADAEMNANPPQFLTKRPKHPIHVCRFKPYN